MKSNHNLYEVVKNSNFVVARHLKSDFLLNNRKPRHCEPVYVVQKTFTSINIEFSVYLYMQYVNIYTEFISPHICIKIYFQHMPPANLIKFILIYTDSTIIYKMFS